MLRQPDRNNGGSPQNGFDNLLILGGRIHYVPFSFFAA